LEGVQVEPKKKIHLISKGAGMAQKHIFTAQKNYLIFCVTHVHNVQAYANWQCANSEA
jgi:hypothetical protein